jgi:beta-glucanase (GH16 family)
MPFDSQGQCDAKQDNEVASSDYVLVWADEFEVDGGLCEDNWHHQTQLPNGDSWYNGELQHYTNRLENTFVQGGNLHIVAKRESFTHQERTKQFTSARLNSKFAFTYGGVDVRAKLPAGSGTWPAIWTLGQNIVELGGFWTETSGTTGWPACGEIDIMEHWGYEPDVVHGSIHTTSSSGATVNTKTVLINDVSTNFQMYSLIWTLESLQFLVNDELFYSYKPSEKNSANWPFDAPQYILLNIAMGGIGGDIDPLFSESEMEIDYVRIYQRQEPQDVLSVSQQKQVNSFLVVEGKLILPFDERV